jgi:hypothetical protein
MVQQCARLGRGTFGEEALTLGPSRVWFRVMAAPIRFEGPSSPVRGVLALLFPPGVLPEGASHRRWSRAAIDVAPSHSRGVSGTS